ncbi:hypothetical protein CEXT_584071 [Caerostris extrusa]|uniref:Uncharacterized protein n=1 Tax=Caerostris extrusa TaxID=172846 RepID=A0AAV4SNP0_CAEEX|nr:hypothetical protein CEXT_584071 [Caerostris extrusa]
MPQNQMYHFDMKPYSPKRNEMGPFKDFTPLSLQKFTKIKKSRNPLCELIKSLGERSNFWSDEIGKGVGLHFLHGEGKESLSECIKVDVKSVIQMYLGAESDIQVAISET